MTTMTTTMDKMIRNGTSMAKKLIIVNAPDPVDCAELPPLETGGCAELPPLETGGRV